MRIENHKLMLSNRDVSAIAKRITGETDIAHAKALDLIAKALGLSGGNALMSQLKGAEPSADDQTAEGAAAAAPKRLPQFRFPGLKIIRDNFSEREIAILEAIATGHTPSSAAELCGVSHRTVDTMLHHIREKLESHSTNQALSRAVALGLVSRSLVLGT